MAKRLLFLLIIMMLLFNVSVTLHAQSDTSLFPTECLMPLPQTEVVGESVHCGIMQVSEDWQDPESRLIEVHYAVLKSHSSTPQSDPVVYLHGGPGGIALWTLALNAEAFDTVRDKRDIIILDQRGSGFSTPLTCDPYPVSDEFYTLEDVGFINNQLCAQGNADNGLDWDGYNSYQSGKDVVELVKQLGYDTFNIHGGSYGTRLGLTILREYPETVRSVTLDGTVPPWITTTTINYEYEQFMMIFSLCAENEACNSEYPNLKARWNALIEQLNENPIESDDFFEPLTGDRLIITLTSDLLNRRYAPRIIAELEARDITTYTALSNRELKRQPISPLVEDGFFEVSYFEEGSDAEAIYFAILEGQKAEVLTDQASSVMAYDLLYRADPEWSRESLADWLSVAYPDDTTLIEKAMALSDEDLRLVFVNSIDLVRRGSTVYKLVNDCQEVHVIDNLDDAIAYYEKINLPLVLRQEEQELRATSDLSKHMCEGFGLKPLPERTFVPFATDIPVLFLQGGADTATPAPWARQAHADMSGSYYVEFPELGHVTLFALDDDCPKQIFNAFLDNPSSEPDATCVKPIAFSMSDEALPVYNLEDE